ncbi:MAG: hypothetical protein AAF298_00330 [Cyanobacteria bacterium P01_A01_bin.40]
MTKKLDTELTQVSVPKKKIKLEIIEGEHLEIILRPFKQRHFATAISIINKYFEQLNQVRQNYISQRQAILDKYEDTETRAIALEELDEGFNEGMEIAKAILAVGDGVAADIKTIIEISIYKATSVVAVDNGTERSPIDPELDDLTWGECAVLLGSVVGLNMDFFNQNTQSMNLEAILNDEPQPKPAPKGGEKSSADSSALVTATAK